MTFNSPPHRKRGDSSLIRDQTLPDVNRLLVSARFRPPARNRLSAGSIPGVRIQGIHEPTRAVPATTRRRTSPSPASKPTHSPGRWELRSDLLISYSTGPKRASPGPRRRAARGLERAKSSTLLLGRNQVRSFLGALPLGGGKPTRKHFVGSILDTSGPRR